MVGQDLKTKNKVRRIVDKILGIKLALEKTKHLLAYMLHKLPRTKKNKRQFWNLSDELVRKIPLVDNN